MWTQTNGPPGGTIRQLIQNPYLHNELYCLVSPGIVYKSDDKGEHWKQISEKTNFVYYSIAAYKDGVFFVGPSGLKFFNGSQISTVLTQSLNSVFISNNKIFVAIDSLNKPRLLYSDLNQSTFIWRDISPSENVLNSLVLPPTNPINPYSIQILNVVNVEDRLLVNILLWVAPGKSQYTNGELAISEDMGKTWSTANLATQSNLKITMIFKSS